MERAISMSPTPSDTWIQILIASYTESLFLFGLLGFLYWTAAPGWPRGLLAGAHGMIMTGTRMVGVPLVIVPWLSALVEPEPFPAPSSGERRRRRGARGLVVGALASLGAAAFFAYCHFALGRWDLYQWTAEQGWGIRTDYLAVFSWKLFALGLPKPEERIVDPEFLSRLSVPIMLAGMAAMFVLECWLAWRSRESGLCQRIPFYLCGVLVFYVCVAAHANRQMSSMLRFSLCVYVPLVLALVHLLARRWPLRGWRDRAFTAAVTAWTTVCVALQLVLTYRFTHGGWVA